MAKRSLKVLFFVFFGTLFISLLILLGKSIEMNAELYRLAYAYTSIVDGSIKSYGDFKKSIEAILVKSQKCKNLKDYVEKGYSFLKAEDDLYKKLKSRLSLNIEKDLEVLSRDKVLLSRSAEFLGYREELQALSLYLATACY